MILVQQKYCKIKEIIYPSGLCKPLTETFQKYFRNISDTFRYIQEIFPATKANTLTLPQSCRDVSETLHNYNSFKVSMLCPCNVAETFPCYQDRYTESSIDRVTYDLISFSIIHDFFSCDIIIFLTLQQLLWRFIIFDVFTFLFSTNLVKLDKLVH